MNRTLMDFWVGLFVFLGIVALVFLSLRVANQSTLTNSDTYSVDAYFINVGGLKPRAPVKSAGVTVGRVKAIFLDTVSYQAKVTMALDRQYPFSTDSSAAILTSGLLGEQYISLETGGEEDVLEDGDVVDITSSAVVLENLIGKFMLESGTGASDKNSP